jgi:hypothetical protein
MPPPWHAAEHSISIDTLLALTSAYAGASSGILLSKPQLGEHGLLAPPTPCGALPPPGLPEAPPLPTVPALSVVPSGCHTEAPSALNTARLGPPPPPPPPPPEPPEPPGPPSPPAPLVGTP